MDPRPLLPLAALALSLLAPRSAAQSPTFLDRPPKPWPQVMILGTVHLDNPGLDVVKAKLDDVLAEKRQREIEAVVVSLAQFAPTKIAVECTPAAEKRINEDYRAYLAGAFELTRNEIHQIGFRLAKELGHSRLHGVDHKLDLDFDAALKYAAEHGQEAELAWFGSLMQKIERHFADLYARGTMAEILAAQNDDAQADDGVAAYQMMSRIGKDASYVGADVAADWYKRNLRIYTNIQRIVDAPSDRVLVVIGGGHRPLLRQLFVQTPGYELVATRPYLENVTPADRAR
jgi:hypothetical protein